MLLWSFRGMSLPAVLDAFCWAPGRSANHKLQMSALELQAASGCPSHLFHAAEETRLLLRDAELSKDLLLYLGEALIQSLS